MIVRSDGHPKARSGYVAEHILIAEDTIGRFLKNGEIVHHIDCDKKNNSPDNLSVLTRAQHSSAHQSINGIIKGLIGAGIVWFDVKNFRYKSKFGEIDIYGRKENIEQRKWRADYIAKHGFGYRKKAPRNLFTIAESHRKPIGKLWAGPSDNRQD